MISILEQIEACAEGQILSIRITDRSLSPFIRAGGSIVLEVGFKPIDQEVMLFATDSGFALGRIALLSGGLVMTDLISKETLCYPFPEGELGKWKPLGRVVCVMF